MIALALALLIGASLVLLGAGGSIVTVPALVYGAGLDAHEAAGTSLFVVGLVAAAGAVAKRRSIELRTGLLFGGAGMLGAVGGAWLNHLVRDSIVLGLFGLTALVAAGRLGRPVAQSDRIPTWQIAALCGVAVGVATGFFGVGGGFLIVPALTLCLGVVIERAVATSLFVIALNSSTGLVTHAALGSVEWGLGARFAAAALLGAGAALPLARRVTGTLLQRLFAGALALVGAGMLIEVLLKALG